MVHDGNRIRRLVGSGKTSLIEQVIALLGARGLAVSLIKHAHHTFDIDPRARTRGATAMPDA